ncbi:unnamed protein product [Schistosoma mattheei]|uniref:Uncharacterized protein n=1 Tax=Schistosoma mattheei TaxID=31246 RepID=A0A183PU62_9TREM|nr:unnamed protein product [Schistosoma mattheei]
MISFTSPCCNTFSTRIIKNNPPLQQDVLQELKVSFSVHSEANSRTSSKPKSSSLFDSQSFVGTFECTPIFSAEPPEGVFK